MTVWPPQLTVSVLPAAAPVPVRPTTTGVPSEASAALMPPPPFSGIAVIDGAAGASVLAVRNTSVPPAPSDVVSTCQGAEALVMPLNCRTAPSDSVTVPVVPEPICPDVTVTVSPIMWTRLVAVRVLPTSRPTIESLNPLAALLVSASSPSDPRKVKVFPSPGSVLSCRTDAGVLPMANTSPELLPIAVLKVRLPPIAVIWFAAPVPDMVSAPAIVPKPLSDPLDVVVPNEMPLVSVRKPPAIRIVPLVTFCVAPMTNAPESPISSV